MNDNYAVPFLNLKKLTNQYYEAMNKKEFVKAYEISIDLNEMVSKLEEYAQNLANEK